jgi:phage repressor protein C with HTH and peptisase S24 domain
MAQSPAILTHAWIWGAIDALAERRGLTPSGLARLAGLDPTAFNRSKRFTPEGRPRWPSTESLSKLLEATGTSLDEFAAIDVALSADAGLDSTSSAVDGPAPESAAGRPAGVPGAAMPRRTGTGTA